MHIPSMLFDLHLAYMTRAQAHVSTYCVDSAARSQTHIAKTLCAYSAGNGVEDFRIGAAHHGPHQHLQWRSLFGHLFRAVPGDGSASLLHILVNDEIMPRLDIAACRCRVLFSASGECINSLCDQSVDA